ncbi:hypothetical protein HC776_03605 [bacterium]|nr:hypothetical protein [bacterium]
MCCVLAASRSISDLHPRLQQENAQRTFDAHGHTYAVEHYWHTEAAYQQAARDAGLRLIAQHNAALPERPDAPLVWLLHLRRDDF